MIRAQRISFLAANQAELQEFDLDEALQPKEVLVQTEYSIISAGTEGASYTGLELEHPGRPATWSYPRPTTGYGNLGRVLAMGAEVTGLQHGDRVLSFSPHATHWKVDTGRMALPVPPEANGLDVVFTRMAGVAITAVRKSSVMTGDTVAVIGLGLVGNFAAQLFQLAGARVLGLDIATDRLARAEACGITHVANSAERDATETVMEWTGGKGARIVVEAIGISQLVAKGVEFTRRHGEIILLGSPRARATFDVTPMLSRIHLQGIRMIGALEWLYPVPENEFIPVSVVENYRQIAAWIMEGRLQVDPLRTHVLSPRECQRAYHGLIHERDEYIGVVFDWSQL